MKWFIIALMGVVFAVNHANAVSLPGSESDTQAAKNQTFTSDSIVKVSSIQAAATGGDLSEMERGQLQVLAQAFIDRFSFVNKFDELFVSSKTSTPSNQSPEPAMLFLFGSGLAGCVYIFRKRL